LDESEVDVNARHTLYSLLKVIGLVVLLIILPLCLGYRLSLALIPVPQVAVIRIEGDIWGFYTDYISQALEEVGNDPAVRAVVLDIVSPGGEVSASEGLYFDVLKLRERKPVIVSIDEMAASGAYYIASAADLIYAKPGSAVGNIGVISVLPSDDMIDEQLITTGPFKLSGGPQVAYIRQMETLKQTFLAAIMAQRADRLRVGPEVLSRGEIYLGIQAQQMGLIDALGSQAEAVAAAAQMARVRRYEVVDRTPWLPGYLFWYAFEPGDSSPRTAATVAAPPEYLPPGIYYRYVEPLP
jgi:protease-4